MCVDSGVNAVNVLSCFGHAWNWPSFRNIGEWFKTDAPNKLSSSYTYQPICICICILYMQHRSQLDRHLECCVRGLEHMLT